MGSSADARSAHAATSLSLAVDTTSFAGSRLGSMLDWLFEGVVAKFETVMLRCGGSHAGQQQQPSGGNGGGDGNTDGAEVVAMLTVLHQFTAQYADMSPFAPEPAVAHGEHDAEAVDAAPTVLYLSKALLQFKLVLLQRLSGFVGEQVAWIHAQRSDPKLAAVLTPFAKFPAFVAQVLEMTGGLVSARFGVFSSEQLTYLLLFII